MAPTETVNQPTTHPTDYRHEPLRRLAALAATTSSVDAFTSEAARLIADHFSSPACAAVVRYRAQDMEHVYNETSANAWTARLKATLLEIQSDPRAIGRLFEAGGERLAVIAAPIPGEMTGAIATLVSCDSREQLEPILHELRAVAATVAAGLAGITRAPSTQTGDTGKAADAIQRAGAYRSIDEFAFALTNNLRNRLGAESVAFALPSHGRARVVSISGLDEVKPRSPGTIAMRQAIEEAMDQRRPLCAQLDGSWDDNRVSTGHALHRAWSASAQNAAVLTIPLFAGEELTAAVAVRRRVDSPFAPEDVDAILELLAPYGPAVPMVSRATRSLLAHARDTACDTAVAAIKPGSWGTKAVAIATTLSLIWFIFGTIPYHVSARARVTPAEKYVFAAPFAGTVSTTAVTVGDRVEPGQLLAEFDTRDLELERSELLASAAAFRVEIDRATAADDLSSAALAAAERDAALARLSTVERRIADARITAPGPGIIIAGEPHELLGQRLDLGEPLFTFVPDNRLRVEVYAPEHAAEDIAAGLPVDFAPDATPGQSIALTLDRVHPATQVHDGKNVLPANAVPADDAHPKWLVPGMEGAARVQAGDRPVWWVTLHRVIDEIHSRWAL